MLRLDIQAIVSGTRPYRVVTSQPVYQLQVLTTVANKLLVKAPQLQKPLAIEQQATTG
ncbi:hypothetical protein D3C79_1063620 [compost metagenome]